MTFIIASSNDKQPHTSSIMHSKNKKAMNYEQYKPQNVMQYTFMK